jgi:hypothetical protein
MADDHVLILGAGFSRSVSKYMPLTDQLGTRAVAMLSSEGHLSGQPGFSQGLTFESWLSLLADDQPQLSEAENRDNAAQFVRLRDAIASLLVDSQHLTMEQPAPSWLYELVSVLHSRQASVITLNYDTLVETAVASHEIWDTAVGRYVDPIDILRNLPRLSDSGGTNLIGPLADTFKLLKLHGSTDWWAVPNDTSGATLNREQATGTFGAPYDMTLAERQQQLPGRERFIIPPLSTKSTYYRNPLTRELWQQADQALKHASRISLIGYSLPAADLVMANMLRSAFDERNIRVDVVNPQPDELSQRLIGLGVSEESLVVTAGHDCVEAFTGTLCGEANAALIRQLGTEMLRDGPDAALAVAWGDSHGNNVLRVIELAQGDNNTLELILENAPPREGATAVRRAQDGTPIRDGYPTAEQLADTIGPYSQLVAVDNRGAHKLISARQEGRTAGASARWIMFTPADPWSD